MRIRRWATLFVTLFVATALLSACSGGGSSSKSGSEEVSVCTKLKERIDKIEDDASIISFSPDAAPSSLELFGVGMDLQEAGYPKTYKSNHNYADVLTFLDVAGSCLSEDAYIYLNNYLELPLIKAIREQDGN